MVVHLTLHYSLSLHADKSSSYQKGTPAGTPDPGHMRLIQSEAHLHVPEDWKLGVLAIQPGPCEIHPNLCTSCCSQLGQPFEGLKALCVRVSAQGHLLALLLQHDSS